MGIQPIGPPRNMMEPETRVAGHADLLLTLEHSTRVSPLEELVACQLKIQEYQIQKVKRQ